MSMPSRLGPTSRFLTEPLVEEKTILSAGTSGLISPRIDMAMRNLLGQQRLALVPTDNAPLPPTWSGPDQVEGHAGTSSVPAGDPPVSGAAAATTPGRSPGTPAAEPPAEEKYVPPPLDESAHPKLNAHQLETISVLERHRGAINMNTDEVENHIDDPNTPADLKRALQEVKDDPTLLRLLDNAGSGGGNENIDNRIGDVDLNAIAEWDEVKQYNAAKADAYADNYIPSDAKDPKSAEPRDITLNDAMREFYKYSDDLPETLSPDELQVAIEGKWTGKQVPPQLIAAARFFQKHPEDWKKIAVDGDGKRNSENKVSRGDLLNTISRNVFLTAEETDTLKTIGDNLDVFLNVTTEQRDGKPVRNMDKHSMLDRDGARKIADDPDNKPEVRRAAQQLVDDPILFGLLDNGQKGHCADRDTYVDDGKFGMDDFDGFMSRLTTKNKTPPPLPARKKQAGTDQTSRSSPADVTTAMAAAKARQDMIDGAADKVLVKETKGGGGLFGGLLKFLRAIVSPVLKVVAQIEHIAATVMGFLSKIPIIGELMAPLSIAAEGMAGVTEIVDAGIQGEDVGKAAEKAALGVAGAAIGAVLLPAAGAALLKGAEKIGVTAAVESASKGVQSVLTRATAPVVDAVKSVATKAAAPFVQMGQSVARTMRNAAGRLGLGGASKSAHSMRLASVRNTIETAWAKVTTPFTKAAEATTTAARSARATITAPFIRLGERAGAAARNVGEKIGTPIEKAAANASESMRRASYRLGLTTPQREAEKAAEKAAARAIKAEQQEADARAAREAENQAAKDAEDPEYAKKQQKRARKEARKEAKKEVKKEVKEELKDRLFALLMNRLLSRGALGKGGFSANDIALLMARQRQIQKQMQEQRNTTAQDKPPTSPANQMQALLKPATEADAM